MLTTSPALVRNQMKLSIEDHLTSSKAEKQMNDIVVRNLLKRQFRLVRADEFGDFLVFMITVISAMIALFFDGSALERVRNAFLVASLVGGSWYAVKQYFCIFNLAKVSKSGDESFAFVKVLLNNSASDYLDNYTREKFMKEFLEAMCKEGKFKRNSKVGYWGRKISCELNKNYKRLDEMSARDELDKQVKTLLTQFQGLDEKEGVVKANLLYQSLKNMNK